MFFIKIVFLIKMVNEKNMSVESYVHTHAHKHTHTEDG
jgi:hypothetical protein